MNDKANPESLGQPRPAFDTRKYVRHIMNSGMPEAQADALVDLLNAALENVVTKDDIKHSLDALEATVKSYADKLSKDDRKFLIRFTTKLVNQLRTDMNSRFDGVDRRLDNVFEELADVRKENKEIRKEITESNRLTQEEIAAAEKRRQDKQAESKRLREQRARDNRRFVVLLIGIVTGLAATIMAILEYLS